MSIHSTAVVDSSVEIDPSVYIGPYADTEAGVKIDKDTRLEAHAVVSGPTTIGERNLIGSFSTVGGAPQDLRYKGEPTELIIGDDNQIREYASIHRETPHGSMQTTIGNNASIGGLVAIDQFCRIGIFLYIGGVSGIGLIIRTPNLLMKDANDVVRKKFPDSGEVQILVKFFKDSQKGVVKTTVEN